MRQLVCVFVLLELSSANFNYFKFDAPNTDEMKDHRHLIRLKPFSHFNARRETIFFLETSGSDIIGERPACAIESAVRQTGRCAVR